MRSNTYTSGGRTGVLVLLVIFGLLAGTLCLITPVTAYADGGTPCDTIPISPGPGDRSSPLAGDQEADNMSEGSTGGYLDQSFSLFASLASLL